MASSADSTLTLVSAEFQCKSGDTLLLRAGGDFYLDPQAGEENPSDVLLIAGGVGINPLYSMIQHLADLNQSPDGPYRANVLMLYSARTYPELIFKVCGHSLVCEKYSHSSVMPGCCCLLLVLC